MQRAIRILRIALPIAFIGFLVVIGLSFRRVHSRQDKSDNIAPTSTIRPHDKPTVESKRFEDTQTIGGRLAMHVVANRVVAFPSGWNTLEEATLTIYRPTGLTYNLICPQAEFNSNTKEAVVKGGVKLTASDGIEITSAEMHYDGNRLTNHIPVQFKIDRWTGNAGALDLDVPEETLRLYDNIDATLQPQTAADSPAHLTAGEGMYRRKENTANFENNVVLVRDRDRFNATHVIGKFATDKKTLMSLEGQGNVLIALGANSPVGSGGIAEGRKEITCDHFWSEMAPDNTISAINATSDPNLTHALIEGEVRRDIVAKYFRVGLKNKEATDIKADQQVVITESGGDVPREISGNTVMVYFDPRTRRPGSAVIDGNFHYKDPRNDARAVRANYDILNDRVILTAQPGFDPTIVTDGNTLKAKTIEFAPRGGTAKATTEVIAQLVSKPNGGPSADATNVFPAGKPVFVNSDTLSIRQATKTAVFNGNVRAWQDTNTLLSQEMQVVGAGDQLTARGNVRMALYNTGNSAAEARKVPLLARSEQLTARKNDRRIELAGTVKIDDEQRHMTGEKAVFIFDANKKVERVEAENKIVLLDQPNNRKATGDKATYYVSRRMAHISGSPATVTSPTGSTTGQQFAIDMVHNKVDVLSPTTPTVGTVKQ